MNGDKRQRQFCLIVCAVLMTVLLEVSESRVLNNINFGGCTDYFYLDQPPVITPLPGEIKAICQTYNNVKYFATLYDKTSRIPVYSAYKPDIQCSGGIQTPQWKVEPQLVSLDFSQNMETLKQRDLPTYKQHQATNEDYYDTNYDRGHLNPNAHHCAANKRIATFTLTNAVPQDPCFNQQQWYEMESHTIDALRSDCVFQGARRYIVTGATPSDKSIPQATDRNEDTPNDDLNRVTIPTHIWTAVCCADLTERRRGWSYGYYGKNQPLPSVAVLSIAQLNQELQLLTGAGTVKIFADLPDVVDCVFNEEESKQQMQQAKSVAVRQNLRILEESSELTSNTVAVKRALGMIQSSSGVPGTKIHKFEVSYTTDVKMNIEFRNTDTNYVMNELGDEQLFCNLDRSLVLSPIGVSHERSTRSLNADTRQCRVQPIERRGDITTQGHLCAADHQCGRRDQDYSWCYIDSENSAYGKCCENECSYKSYTESYTCDVGSEPPYRNVPCVPNMSVDITYNGKLCRSDHICGKHGESYYWCYTGYGGGESNWDRCCATWDVCGPHGSAYDWCYTSDSQKWMCIPLMKRPHIPTDMTTRGHECVNGHRCDYHGYPYSE